MRGAICILTVMVIMVAADTGKSLHSKSGVMGSFVVNSPFIECGF